MRKSYKFAKRKKVVSRYKANEEIRAPQVSVIDHEGGFLGVMDTPKAIAYAEDLGLDLVEVNPNADPPVAKIINYGSFKYKQEKFAKEQKKTQKKVDVKGIRLSTKISDHDIETRLIQAEKFLGQGHKVKVELILRGREFQHMDLARKVITDFVEKIKTPYQIEQQTGRLGNKMTMIIMPVSTNNN